VSQASRSPIGLVVVAYLLLQVAIPTAQLFAERPARYAWQLFQAGTHADYVLIDEIGPSTIDPRDFVVASWGDLDEVAYLTPHLCAVVPETREIRVVRSADTIPTLFPCDAR
jgi:hypothetical protein